MKAARYDLAVTGSGNAVQIKRQLRIDFVLMDQKFTLRYEVFSNR
jgi:hypothetical protein